ncbi:hypothetical protein HNP38_002718 [Chryseobacterium defluvii]|uniref:Pesticidal crystal protein Cry22Aa Ig-like domain-containing protein n=1 Tax=Chryseobacterium defluvii TaxID=160396 RepID=A0A840KKL7_9FLAO|nr:immunoglobulin-like domain-containing protein [Chryseobacterium defluvii]MBB4807412.1 hypothetical protein [Chryseobacterium defluvii]
MKYNKIIKFFAINVLTFFVATSCSSDHETSNVSNITNYPVLELKGSNPTLVQLGSSFTDPGISATENNSPIPYETTYKGDYRGGSALNLSVSDRYVATYKATNKDGFFAVFNRNIYVYKTGNFIDSIEGLYMSRVVRTPAQGVVSPTTDWKYILIWRNGDGTYEVSDAIGGYYEFGRSYGVTYASRGLKLNYSAGVATVASQPSGVGAFGGNISVTSVTVTPATKKIVLSSTWDSGYDFVATLTQVN